MHAQASGKNKVKSSTANRGLVDGEGSENGDRAGHARLGVGSCARRHRFVLGWMLGRATLFLSFAGNLF